MPSPATASSPDVHDFSRIEQAFERVRVVAGLVLAPLLFVLVLFSPFEGLKPEAHRLAAVMAAVVVLWITEALPMPATALAGAAAAVILGVAPAKEVFAPFADPLIFLFIGSFFLARAIFLHHLDRRLAFGVLSLGWVSGRPERVLFAFGAVTLSISAWISNTATTAMMFAIGLSILSFYQRDEGNGPSVGLGRRYATGIMLMTSFAATIGGLATPIGTPTNLIGLGLLKESLGWEMPFFNWMILAAPIVLVMFGVLYAYLRVLCPAEPAARDVGRELLTVESQRLGRWTVGQISTLVAFALTVALWLLPGFVALLAGEESATYKFLQAHLPESVVALVGGLSLFLLPGERGRRAITWEEAAEIDWGVVLLYGGGITLGQLANQTGLAAAVGHGIADRLPIEGGLGLLIVSAAVATLISELTSNTASVTIVVPLVIAIAQASGADPVEPALGATMASSLGFMLPVSTPCNAIVYSSRRVPLSRMIAYGAMLDVVGFVTIVTCVHLLVPLLR